MFVVCRKKEKEERERKSGKGCNRAPYFFIIGMFIRAPIFSLFVGLCGLGGGKRQIMQVAVSA